MFPKSLKKTGYSLKDTFIVMVKCFIMIFFFSIFLVWSNTNDVDAAASRRAIIISDRYDGFAAKGTCTNASGAEHCSSVKYTVNKYKDVYYVKLSTKRDSKYFGVNNSRHVGAKISVNGSNYTGNSANLDDELKIGLVFMDRTNVVVCNENASCTTPISDTSNEILFLMPYKYMRYSITVTARGAAAYGSENSSYAVSTTVTIDGSGLPVNVDDVVITCDPVCGTWTTEKVTIMLDGEPYHYFSDPSIYQYSYFTTSGFSSWYNLPNADYMEFDSEINRIYRFRTCSATNVCSTTINGGSSGNTFTVKIDRTDPTVTGYFKAEWAGELSDVENPGDHLPDTGYTPFASNISLTDVPTCTDAVSGCKYYMVTDMYSYMFGTQVKLTTETVYDSSKSSTLNFSLAENAIGGKHTLSFTWYDYAENYTTYSEDFVITVIGSAISADGITFSVSDGIKETGKQIAPHAGYTNSTKLNVSITASGAWKYGIVEGTSVLQGVSTNIPVNVTLASTKEGEHELILIVYNHAGRKTEKKVTIIYDGTDPKLKTALTLKGKSTDPSGYTTQAKVTHEAASTDTYPWKYVIFVGTTEIASSGGPSSSGTYTLSAEGKYTYEIRFYDNAGNVVVDTREITYDKTPPIATVACNNGACDVWYAGTTTAVATPSDGSGSGVKSTTYTVSGAASVSKTTGTSYTLDESDGDVLQATVTFTITDYAGNTGTASAEIWIDRKAPTGMSVSCENSAGAINCTSWSNKDITIKASGAIDDPGVGGVYYQHKKSTENDTKWVTGNSVKVDTNGVVMQFRACDSFGNCTGDQGGSIIDTTAKIDKAPPTVTVKCNGAACNVWYGDDTTASATATDGSGSGVKSDTWTYSVTGAVTTSGSGTSYKLTKTTGKLRTATVVFKVKDNAGNEGSGSGIVKIDKEAPTVTVKCNNGACNVWYDGTIDATATPSDGSGSGVKTTTYVVTGSETVSKTTGTSYTLDESDGEVLQATITFTVEDNVGNKGTGTGVMMIDRKAPTGMVVKCESNGVEIDCSSWSNKDIIIKASGATDSPGVGGVYYQHKKSTEADTKWVKSSSVTVSTNGDIIQFRACDSFGNCTGDFGGSIINTTVKIDKTSPEVRLNEQSLSANISANIGASLPITVTDSDGSGLKASSYTFNYYITTKRDDICVDESRSFGSVTSGNAVTVMKYLQGTTAASYYIYFYIIDNAFNINDNAGNEASYYTEKEINSTNGKTTYLIYEFKITPTTTVQSGYTEPEEDMWNKIESVLPEGSYSEDNKYLQIVEDEVNVLELQNNKYIIVTLNKTTCSSDGKKVAADIEGLLSSKFGLTLTGTDIGSVSTTEIYMDRVLRTETGKPITLTIVVIDNTLYMCNGLSNSGDSVSVTQGEELENVGLSYVSKNGEEVEVTTEITLDGVKVKSIDTNKVGVYTIRQVARDSEGRTVRSTREIIVEAKVEEKVEEVLPVVEVEEVVATVPQVIETRVEVEEVRSEIRESNTIKEVVRLEEGVKVKGYKKKKEVKKVKKEKFSFKLFSKWFFKIYDG